MLYDVQVLEYLPILYYHKVILHSTYGLPSRLKGMNSKIQSISSICICGLSFIQCRIHANEQVLALPHLTPKILR